MTNQKPNDTPDDNENGGEDKNEAAGFVRPGFDPNGTDAESEEEKLKKEREAANRRDAIAAAAAAATALTRQKQLEDEENTAYDKSEENAEQKTEETITPEEEPKAAEETSETVTDEPAAEEPSDEDTLRAEFNRRALALGSALCKIYNIESVAEPILNELSQTVDVQSEAENSFTAKGTDDVMNVSRDQIYAENSGVTPATAYEMVLMGLADPTLRDIGVEVRGNARDRLMLSVMAAKSGLTVLNAPQNIDADMLASVEADIADWVKAKSAEKPDEKPAATLPVKRAAPEPGVA